MTDAATPSDDRGAVGPDERPALLVSACLLGVSCNHEGGHSRHAALDRLLASYRVVPVCPEVLGGLTTPRPAAEIVGGTGADVLAGTARVLTAAGDDVTALYRRGARATLVLAAAADARRAVLEARSPSCGTVEIYDGSHTRTLRPGAGVTAAILAAAGVEVCSEDDLDTLPG